MAFFGTDSLVISRQEQSQSLATTRRITVTLFRLRAASHVNLGEFLNPFCSDIEHLSGAENEHKIHQYSVHVTKFDLWWQ